MPATPANRGEDWGLAETAAINGHFVIDVENSVPGKSVLRA